MKTSQLGYFQSLADELRSQSLRVRQLIGDAHWGHDGRHKEVLLQTLIRRHCPPTVIVSTGFVISQNDPEVRSKEQDLLVIDASTEAPLFHQGDLVIAFPHTIIAAVSIKSTLNDATLKDVVAGLKSVRETARNANCKASRLWCGGFFFKLDDNLLHQPEQIYKSLKTHITENPAHKPIIDDGLPHISGPDIISEASNLSFLIDYTNANEIKSATIRGFDCQGISTAVFISCLLEHISIFFDRKHSAFSDSISMFNLQGWILRNAISLFKVTL